MNSSKESGFRTFIFDAPPEYEEMIQKLEGDVRKHIRTQNQLKLHIESLQQKQETAEKKETEQLSEIQELKLETKMLKQSLNDARQEESIKVSELTQEYEEKLEAAHSQMRQMQMNLSQNMVCTSKNISFGAQEDHCNTSTPTIRTNCGPGLTTEN